MRAVVLALSLTACGGSHPLGDPAPPPTWPMADQADGVRTEADRAAAQDAPAREVLLRFSAGEPPASVVASCGDEGLTDDVVDGRGALTLPGGVPCALRTGGDDPADIDLPADAPVVDCRPDATGWNCVPGLPTPPRAPDPPTDPPQPADRGGEASE